MRGDDPGGSPDGATEDETVGGTGQVRTAESADPVPEDGDAPGDEDAPADAGGESGDEPDPALVTKLTGHLDQITAAAD